MSRLKRRLLEIRKNTPLTSYLCLADTMSSVLGL